jgi:NADH:ubiquinone oxidoreductase subunit
LLVFPQAKLRSREYIVLTIRLLFSLPQNGDFPFKFGTYMGCDAAGNRYYENRVDYPLGQHRWVEPGDIHNFDATQIPPEWHGWMTSMNDATPSMEQEYIEKKMENLRVGEISHAPYRSNIGHQEPYFNFHHMHNQSQIRSRGYNIGNQVVGLPPGAPDAYYTQPGSPYNDASIRKFDVIGDLDEAKGGGRPYKSEMWKERLMTAEEKEAEKNKDKEEWAGYYEKKDETKKKVLTVRERAILQRGGTLASM